MTPKRFVAANAREAMQQVRAELGLDAVILSNRSVPEGVEIVAAAMGAIASLIAPAATPVPAAVLAAPAVPVISALPAAPTLQPAPALTAAPLVSPAVWRNPRDDPKKPLPVATFDAQAARTQEMELLAEIRAMKNMLSEQVASLSWSETLRHRPLRGRILRTLLDAGFSPMLARSLVSNLPDDYAVDAARDWVTQLLARNLQTATSGDIIDCGGIYALVGPTGVGKTTTTAKLAARCVMKHGASRLGLIVTDDYRIGAQDQLRIYGRLLGVPVYVAQTPDELQQALAAMSDKHLVLIDTVGMGQHDDRIAAQHDLLISSGVQRLLLLNSTAQSGTLDQVVRAYTTHRKGNVPIAGAILTKLDESARPGCALDVIIRRKLPLHYTTAGQRVPEDIALANPKALAQRALYLGGSDDPVFSLDENEAGLFMTANTGEMALRT